MTINDWIEVGFLASWIICLIGVGVFSHIHFKNKRAERYRQDAVFAMEKWVGYYDKQAVENPEKAAGALNDAVKELQGKGYKINDQNVKDLEALREWAVTRLRFEQAKADVDNTVKPEPEIAENVPANEVVQPTESETGEVNGK